MYSFPYLESVCCSMSSSNCCFFTYIRFLRRQVRWSGIPISWRIFHNLLWSTWSKPLVYSQWSRSRCFSVIPLFFSMIQQMLAIWSLVPLPFLNPASTSGSSRIPILLQPTLKDFEQYFASVWHECNCAGVWTFFGTAFFQTGMKSDLFQKRS